MVAIAPITNETPTRDVRDAFQKLHSRAREAKTTPCTEVPSLKSRSRIEIWITIYETCDRLESFTRDTIGFRGSPFDLYEFCKANALNRKDPSGLTSDPRLPGEGGRCGCNVRGVGMVVPTCEKICEAALRDPKIDKSGTAGVICFQGIKCACVFGFPFLFAPGDCPKVDEILKSHERKHFDEVNCGGGCDLSRPPFKPGVDPITTECHHRRQSLKELQALLDDPKTEAFCKIVIRRLGGGLQAWVDANCGGVPVVNE